MDTALFSPSSLFQLHSSGSDDEDEQPQQKDQPAEGEKEQQQYVERTHTFPGAGQTTTNVVIREFSFHQLNANLLWPGTFAFCDWLLLHNSLLQGRILELGSGTGALAIYLRKSFGVDITTSDFDDKEVEQNIAYNCRANGLSVLPHIRHSWGDIFPVADPDWDFIIASDILLYVKQYPNLVKTLSFLLKSYKQKDVQAKLEPYQLTSSGFKGRTKQVHFPAFIMSWRRRIGKEDEALFFDGCRDAGLFTEHLGSRVYCITAKNPC